MELEQEAIERRGEWENGQRPKENSKVRENSPRRQPERGSGRKRWNLGRDSDGGCGLSFSEEEEILVHITDSHSSACDGEM